MSLFSRKSLYCHFLKKWPQPSLQNATSCCVNKNTTSSRDFSRKRNFMEHPQPHIYMIRDSSTSLFIYLEQKTHKHDGKTLNIKGWNTSSSFLLKICKRFEMIFEGVTCLIQILKSTLIVIKTTKKQLPYTKNSHCIKSSAGFLVLQAVISLLCIE